VTQSKSGIVVPYSGLADALEAQKKAEGIKWYTPHAGQQAFHQSLAKIRALFGGNRSGKTTGGMAEVALFATHSQRYRKRPKGPIKILCGSESNEYNRDIIVPKLRKFLPQGTIVQEVKIGRGFIDYWLLSDGSTVKFKNYEQDADKWAGDDYDIISLDEEPPYDIWVECKMRTIDRGGEIILTMTPVKGLTFIYTDIWEKRGTTGIDAWLMDMDLNPHLNQKDKELVLAGLTEQERKIRKEGKFVALHGLVYPQFNEAKHVIPGFEIPFGWTRIVTIDPHLRKPTSILWLAVASHDFGRVSKGDWVVYRELRRNGIIPDIATSILVANGRERVSGYLADPALNIKDNITGVNPFDEFANSGISLIPANKHFQSGVYEIRKLLDQTPSGLWIFDTCIGVINEFRHYTFADIEDQGKSYSEKVLKRDDDYMDCLRYGINSGIKPRNEQPPTNYKYSTTGRILGVDNFIRKFHFIQPHRSSSCPTMFWLVI
jgi:phage terminase large subunit-like protein